MSEVAVAVLLVVGFVALVAATVGIATWLPHLQQGRRAKRWAAGPKTHDGLVYYPVADGARFLSFGTGDADVDGDRGPTPP